MNTRRTHHRLASPESKLEMKTGRWEIYRDVLGTHTSELGAKKDAAEKGVKLQYSHCTVLPTVGSYGADRVLQSRPIFIHYPPPVSA